MSLSAIRKKEQTNSIMSQVGRQMKNLEAPRPLKSSMSRTVHQTPLYGLQTSNFQLESIDLSTEYDCEFQISVEELITLVESVAGSLSTGQCNPDSMTLLLTNLRMHGPQLEEYSKSTLDQGECTLSPHDSNAGHFTVICRF